MLLMSMGRQLTRYQNSFTVSRVPSKTRETVETEVAWAFYSLGCPGIACSMVRGVLHKV